jgi:hypothetical protein
MDVATLYQDVLRRHGLTMRIRLESTGPAAPPDFGEPERATIPCYAPDERPECDCNDECGECDANGCDNCETEHSTESWRP